MADVKDRLKAQQLRAAREKREVTAEEMQTEVDRSNEMDKPLRREGFGGRGREIAAIERNRLIAINVKSAPFEWLSSKGYLETRADKPGIGNIRFSAGMEFRDLLLGAEPMGLKSANIEGGSGGGGVPSVINDFKMDCLGEIIRLRKVMFLHQAQKRVRKKGGGTAVVDASYADRPILFALLERLIYRDEWIFEKMTKAKQKAVMEQVHHGLDQVAMFFGLITPREFDSRWQQSDGRV